MVYWRICFINNVSETPERNLIFSVHNRFLDVSLEAIWSTKLFELLRVMRYFYLIRSD